MQAISIMLVSCFHEEVVSTTIAWLLPNRTKRTDMDKEEPGRAALKAASQPTAVGCPSPAKRWGLLGLLTAPNGCEIRRSFSLVADKHGIFTHVRLLLGEFSPRASSTVSNLKNLSRDFLHLIQCNEFHPVK